MKGGDDTVDQLRQVFEETVQGKLSEIETKNETIGEVKAAIRELTWSKDALEQAVGKEVERRFIEKWYQMRHK